MPLNPTLASRLCEQIRDILHLCLYYIGVQVMNTVNHKRGETLMK